MNERRAQILAAFLDGVATEAECGELLEAIRHDPDFAQAAAAELEVHRLLGWQERGLAGEAETSVATILYRVKASQDTEAFLGKVKEKVRREQVRATPARGKRRRLDRSPRASAAWLVPLAAAVLAGVTLAIAFRPQPAREAPAAQTGQAHLGEIVFVAAAQERHAVLVRAQSGAQVPLAVGMAIREGDRIETPAGSNAAALRAVLASARFGGAHLDLSDGTRVQVSHGPAGAAKLELLQGLVFVNTRSSLAIGSPMAELSLPADGAQFELRASHDETRLRVAAGVVGLRALGSAGQSGRAGAFEQLTALRDGSLAGPEAFPAEELWAGRSTKPPMVAREWIAGPWQALPVTAGLAEWNVLRGHWHAENGMLVGENPDGSHEGRPHIETRASYRDFELTCEMRIEHERYGEIFVRGEDWSFENLVGENMGRWRKVRVLAQDTKVQCWIDGEPAQVEWDGSRKPVKAGPIGFYGRLKARVSLRDLRLRTFGR